MRNVPARTGFGSALLVFLLVLVPLLLLVFPPFPPLPFFPLPLPLALVFFELAFLVVVGLVMRPVLTF